MQADSELTGDALQKAQTIWLRARDLALQCHEALGTIGLHKQIANRIIEPWFHIQLIVSATEYQNFFALRCHSAAHPDIQSLADQMLDCYMLSTPVEKKAGEYHLPYGDQHIENLGPDILKKVCVARAARLSYMNFDKTIDVEDDIKLHDRLASSGHMSPFEHVAQATVYREFFGNFYSWYQYRLTFENQNRRCDLKQLWDERKKLRS